MEQKIIAAGMLAICPETGRYLILKRRNDVKYPGYWGLPGGFLDEEDGYPKITAIREFKEETKYKGLIKLSKEPLFVEKSNHLDFYFYVGILPYEFVPDLQGECKCSPESLDYKWIELDCKNDNIIPTIISTIELKRDLIEKVINKFKNKNYE